MGCPRCGGFIYTHYDDTKCLNCSYRHGDIGRQVGSADALNWVDRNPPSEKELQEVEF